jgi:hypothetical protein
MLIKSKRTRSTREREGIFQTPIFSGQSLVVKLETASQPWPNSIRMLRTLSFQRNSSTLSGSTFKNGIGRPFARVTKKSSSTINSRRKKRPRLKERLLSKELMPFLKIQSS